MSMSNTFYMKLNDILDNYNPAFDVPWDEALSYDGRELWEVEKLAEVLSSGGKFREPVHLFGGGESVDDDGVAAYDPPAVVNGHHRLAAHKLSGVDDVLVTFDELPNGESPYIVVTMRAVNGSFEDDDIDKMWEWLRLDLGPSGWLIPELGSTFGKSSAMYLASSVMFVENPVPMEEIAKKVNAVLVESGLDKVLVVEDVAVDEDDDND